MRNLEITKEIVNISSRVSPTKCVLANLLHQTYPTLAVKVFPEDDKYPCAPGVYEVFVSPYVYGGRNIALGEVKMTDTQQVIAKTFDESEENVIGTIVVITDEQDKIFSLLGEVKND